MYDDKKIITDAVEVAKKVQTDEKAEKEALEAAVKELNEAIMPIGAKMYESAEADAGSGEESSDDKSSGTAKKPKKGKKSKDEPIEGEVVND